MEKKFDKFFNARVVAMIGFSPSPGNLGRSIVINCKRWGYAGKIYGVSPQQGEFEGAKIVNSLKEIPEPVDLALIITKAAIAPQVLLDCAKHGIKNVAITSAGFEEVKTAEGFELAGKVREICLKYDISMVGPNGIATSSTNTGLCLSFMPLSKPPVGKIAFLTQSGGVGTTMLEHLKNDAVPLGKFVSLGNKTMLDEVDFLDYLAEDPETGVICIYLEDLRRGREFLESAKKCQKPVIVYKANISPYGQNAAGTHTAAMANNEQVMDCAFRQAGVIRAKSLIEMFHLAKAFSMPAMKGNRLLVISPSGGLAVILGDLAWKHGFELPPIPREIYDKYMGQRRAGVIDFKNPLDFGDIYSAEIQRNFLRDLLRHDSFDGLCMAYLFRDPAMLKMYMNLNQLQRDIVAEFIETVDTIKKPVGCTLTIPYHLKEEIQARSPYPIFDGVEESVACMATLRDFYRRAEKKKKRNP
jgi:acetate---CoA ligase (ADP-forming)